MEGVEDLDIRDGDGAAVLAVKAVPGASRDRIAGALGGALKIAVAAPPEKGKANAAVAGVLAAALGVDRRRVTLVAGATRARKQFRIAGLGAAAVRAALRGIG